MGTAGSFRSQFLFSITNNSSPFSLPPASSFLLRRAATLFPAAPSPSQRYSACQPLLHWEFIALNPDQLPRRKQNMGGVVTETKRFFKVMMPGFNEKLNLPNKLSQVKLEQAVLKTCSGTFKVKVCRDQELGCISFVDGWPDFFKHHGLCVGDFVVFEHVGNFHFNAFIYDESACEKGLLFSGLFSGPKRFYKVMMPGFNCKLSLPEKLSNKLIMETSAKAVLTSCMGTFEVKMCRNKESGLVTFEDGWPQFVNSHGLCIEEFVTFEHVANLHFNAILFDESACEKVYPLDRKKKAQDHIIHIDPEETEEAPQRDKGTFTVDPKEEPQEAPQRDKGPFIVDPKEEPQEAPMRKRNMGSSSMGVPFKSDNPFFMQTIRYFHVKQDLSIPLEFRRSNGIGKGKTNAILRDPRGRSWPVKLGYDKNGRQDRCRIGKGWKAFYNGNKLKSGDVCAFELITNDSNNFVMDVHIFPALS